MTHGATACRRDAVLTEVPTAGRPGSGVGMAAAMR
jgi:hypothetical protein